MIASIIAALVVSGLLGAGLVDIFWLVADPDRIANKAAAFASSLALLFAAFIVAKIAGI